MPFAEWYLSRWGNERDFARVQIDPAEVWGSRGIFGQMLVLPYKLPKREGSSASLELLSLEGWIGLGNVTESDARLPIPSQIVWPAQYRLQVSITNRQIEAIEEARKGGQVNLIVWLGGVASGDQGLLVVQSTNSSWLTIERERWLAVLQQLGAGTRRLVELPEPHLPRGMHVWAECLRLLNEATEFYRSGSYEQVLINCRKIAEGIPQVICDVWGVPQKTAHQSVGQWLRNTVEPQLTAAWPQDSKSPVMIRTMLSGVWEWAAPAPHYGTEMPLREKGAFALELCTSLLHFAGQVLQAHPDPTTSVS